MTRQLVGPSCPWPRVQSIVFTSVSVRESILTTYDNLLVNYTTWSFYFEATINTVAVNQCSCTVLHICVFIFVVYVLGSRCKVSPKRLGLKVWVQAVSVVFCPTE